MKNIEKTLHVTLILRDDKLKMIGDEADCRRAKAVLDQLRTDVDLVVHSYLQYDWHCFMDYQWGSKNGDWRDKTRLFLKKCKGL